MMKTPKIIAAAASIAVLAVLAVLLLDPFSGGESEADVTVAGVPVDELAKSGFIVEAAPADATPAVSEESVVTKLTENDPDLAVLDAALVTFKTEEGIYTEPRLAWAVSLDPKTLPPEQIHGGGFGLSDEERASLLPAPDYAVEFFDAETGEFLMAATSSSGD
jgi:hypothetical protein